MAVAEWTGALVDWRAELKALKEWVAPALGRAKTRASAGAFIDGLLSPAERKTGWMLAEQAGLDRPHRIQSLLGRSMWSADALRDRVRDYVAEAIGDEAGIKRHQELARGRRQDLAHPVTRFRLRFRAPGRPSAEGRPGASRAAGSCRPGW